MFVVSQGRVAAALLATAVAFAVATVAGRPTHYAVEHVTFAAPVALPEVTLVPGEYTFQANHVDSGHLVQVRQRHSNRVVYQGFTTGVERTRLLPGSMVFGEPGPGQAPPLVAWYPSGEFRGYRFRYPNQ